MVLGVRSVKLDVYSPIPVPSCVQLSRTLGFPTVFQHTPRDVTSAPPSEMTSPKILAVVSVTFPTDFVTTVGFSISGLHDTNIITSATKNNDSFFITYLF